MLSWGSKFFFGASVASLLAALVFGLSTGGDPIGVISAGYKGGVGDHFGYVLLLAAAGALFAVGLTVAMSRDGDAEDLAAMVGVDEAPRAQPLGPSVWGPVTAFGVGCVVVGLAMSTVFFFFGLALLGVIGMFWAVDAWSDRATGDPAANRILRDRVLAPVEVPVLGILVIGAIVLGISRVLLAVSEIGSVVVASVVAVAIFLTAIAMAKVSVPRNVIAAILVVGGLAVLAGGIVGAAVGPREFEHHDDHSDEDHEALVVGGLRL